MYTQFYFVSYLVVGLGMTASGRKALFQIACLLLLEEVVDSPSLEAFKARLWLWAAGGGGWRPCT